LHCLGIRPPVLPAARGGRIAAPPTEAVAPKILKKGVTGIYCIVIIPLSNSQKVVVVDEEVGPSLMQWEWRLRKDGYVYRSGPSAGIVLMHRQIMQRELYREKGYVVDHIDGDKLNCRRSNMRVVKQGTNILNNYRPRKDNTSGVVGVSWFARGQKWKVYLGHKYHGSFGTLEEAAAVRKALVERAGGRHSRAVREPAVQVDSKPGVEVEGF
jgi:hypothetical protein